MTEVSRRSFLKAGAVVTAGAFFIPNLLSCSPGNKLNIAIVGAGGRGADNWHALFADSPEDANKPKDQRKKVLTENVVAICDEDEIGRAHV